MKLKVFVLALVVVVVSSCGGGEKKQMKMENHTPKTEVKKEVSTEVATSDAMSNKGIGPIKSLELGELDTALAGQGKQLFKAKCSACHKISKRFVGPGLKGITKRRSPEWIMNMILNPEEMVQKDPIAMELLAEYNAPMANQSLTEDEARAILEYFRTK